MIDKKRYYKLDDIGFIGTQKKKSALQKKREAVKTGEIIRRRKGMTSRKKSALKKVS